MYKDIMVVESEDGNSKLYGLRVRTGGLKDTDVIISEDGSLDTKLAWKPVDVSGFLLSYRTYKQMKIIQDRLEGENQPWFDIRTRKNEAETARPYTLGIICPKSKLNELDEFLGDWGGFGREGMNDVNVRAGEEHVKNFLEMSLIIEPEEAANNGHK